MDCDWQWSTVRGGWVCQICGDKSTLVTKSLKPPQQYCMATTPTLPTAVPYGKEECELVNRPNSMAYDCRVCGGYVSSFYVTKNNNKPTVCPVKNTSVVSVSDLPTLFPFNSDGCEYIKDHLGNPYCRVCKTNTTMGRLSSVSNKSKCSTKQQAPAPALWPTVPGECEFVYVLGTSDVECRVCGLVLSHRVAEDHHKNGPLLMCASKHPMAPANFQVSQGLQMAINKAQASAPMLTGQTYHAVYIDEALSYEPPIGKIALRCGSCAVELCDYLDAYHGKATVLKKFCVKCRNKVLK